MQIFLVKVQKSNISLNHVIHMINSLFFKLEISFIFIFVNQYSNLIKFSYLEQSDIFQYF